MEQFRSYLRLIRRSLTHAVAVGLPSTAEPLPDDPALLKSMILELLAALQQRDHDNDAIRQRLDLLLRRRYGPRTERFDPNQRWLFSEDPTGQDLASAPPPAPPEEPKPKRKCRPHGRRRLPENLPRVPKHYQVTPAERIGSCCGPQRQELGTETSEQLDYQPASRCVIEPLVPKYVGPCCSKAQEQALPLGREPMPPQQTLPIPEASSPLVRPRGAPSEAQEPMTKPTARSLSADQPIEPATPSPAECPRVPPAAPLVRAATKPALPLAKGLAGPGLLAHLIVSTYEEHLPRYRLENIYERQGVFLPRSTLCDWLMASAGLLRPL